MKALLAIFVGLGWSALVAAEPLVEGRVRLASGAPVPAVQVMVFDLTDLARGPVARATTDASGYFALASLGGPARPQHFALGQNYPNPFNPSTVIPVSVDDGRACAAGGVQCVGAAGGDAGGWGAAGWVSHGGLGRDGWVGAGRGGRGVYLSAWQRARGVDAADGAARRAGWDGRGTGSVFGTAH